MQETINLNPRELEVSRIKTGDWKGTEQVQLKWHVSTDAGFIETCRALGVQNKKPKKDETSPNF